MQERYADLLRVAQLMKLAAASARELAQVSATAHADRIKNAADRIERAAGELIEAVRQGGGGVETLS